jgi:hypothetical protein
VSTARGHSFAHITAGGYRNRRQVTRDRRSINGIMAPIPDPKKRRICREELPGVHDSRPLGAAMDSSAFFRSRREQVLPQRGHAFRPHHGTAAEINVVEISERRARLGTVEAKRIDSVQIQTGDRLVEMPWRTSQELRGRLLASGLEAVGGAGSCTGRSPGSQGRASG